MLATRACEIHLHAPLCLRRVVYTHEKTYTHTNVMSFCFGAWRQASQLCSVTGWEWICMTRGRSRTTLRCCLHPLLPKRFRRPGTFFELKRVHFFILKIKKLFLENIFGGGLKNDWIYPFFVKCTHDEVQTPRYVFRVDFF